jgi:membrane-anchored glycerophosphoryl diester phosphodiesterase (GDPDase)
MHEPTYREALRTAWNITTAHPFLIIFGLFSIFVGQVGLLDLVMKVGLVGTEGGRMPLWAMLPSLGVMETISLAGFTVQAWVLLAWVFAIIIGFGLFFTFVSVSSHGALIHATAQYVQHPRKEVLINDAWHAGVSHFWKLFGIIALKKVAIGLLGFGISVAMLNAVLYASAWDAVLFILLFIVALAAGMWVSFIAIYAAGYIVIEEYSIGDALRSAWELCKEHWLVSIEIGITVLVLNILAGVLALASLSLLFIPTILLWATASQLASSVILFQLGSFIAVGLFVLLIATVGSLLSVYTTALWMDLFQHMHRRGIASRIVRRITRS